MKNSILDNPTITAAIVDLKKALTPVMDCIEQAFLFGSTVEAKIDEAKDIDFFLAYKEGSDFEKLRQRIASANLHRRIVVQAVEGGYSNCPPWPKEEPLTIHIVLFRKGVSKFSPKLLKGYERSVDITERLSAST